MKNSLTAILITAMLALATWTAAIATWDGSDVLPVAGGLVIVDAYTYDVSIPMFGVTIEGR